MNYSVYNKDTLKKLNTYLRIHGKNYSKCALEYIKSRFAYLDGEMNDIMFQIYAYLNMLEKHENFYLNFAEMILDKYGKDVSVLEIGGGCLPMLAKILRDLKKEKNAGGKITVYDPYLVIHNLRDVDLKKQEFKTNIDISEYDLLVGIMPCQATRTMIRSAIRNDKEFLLGMCGCIHYEDYEITKKLYNREQITYEGWLNDVYNLALRQRLKGYDVKIENLEFDYPYQVISSKKLTKK